MATLYFTRQGLMPYETVSKFIVSRINPTIVEERVKELNNDRTNMDHAISLEYHYLLEDMTADEFMGHRMHFMTAEEIAKEDNLTVELLDEEKALIAKLDSEADEYALAVYESTNEVDMDMTVDDDEEWRSTWNLR